MRLCRTPPRFEVPSVLIAALRFCRISGCVIIYCDGRGQTLPVASFAIFEFCPPPADNIGVFGVKFHCFAHSTGLFTGNKCTSGTAEGVNDGIVKAMVFPVVMYGCESWTVKKAEC